MLFRMVCGPDMEEAWRLSSTRPEGITWAELLTVTLQRQAADAESTTMSEAASVLRTLGLLDGTDPLTATALAMPFQLAFLSRLRDLASGRANSAHPLDPWYLQLLEELFIRPDAVYLPDLHPLANRLPLPAPLNIEKLNAWRRVMEWFGVGRRVGTGFMVVYSPALVSSLLEIWRPTEGSLAEFLLDHVNRFLPCDTEHGDLPQALRFPLIWLEQQGAIELLHRQDSPHKAYLGTRRINWLCRKERASA